MKPTVYIETSIVSYLAAWPSKDPLRQAHQIATKRWWTTRADAFSLCTSQIVIEEARAGDADAASERLTVLRGLALIELGPDVLDLADRLIAGHALPEKARVDAAHVAAAASNGVEYLMTWNCKHLANAVLRDKIEEVCTVQGFRAPLICTPLELLEEPDEL
jgi:hypothetical protein